jgi:hypothetical protein
MWKRWPKTKAIRACLLHYGDQIKDAGKVCRFCTFYLALLWNGSQEIPFQKNIKSSDRSIGSESEDDALSLAS